MKTLWATCLFGLLSCLSYAQPTPAEEQLGERDAHAKRQAEAAIASLQLGQHKMVWPLLKQRADPSLRSYLIRDMSRAGIPADVLINQVKTEKDAFVRRALLLALGGFSDKQLPEFKRKPLVNWLLQLYRTDPDPGIHSAIDWLLRYGQQGHEDRKIDWQQGKILAKIDSSLSGQPANGRNWYVTTKGHTMAVFGGPIEFIMGSPGNEPGRDKTNIEVKHRQQIPRSFAVATKEVTIAQFQQFFDANPAIRQLAQAAGQRDPTRNGQFMKRVNGDERCPQVFITWFEAAQYCNWLSSGYVTDLIILIG